LRIQEFHSYGDAESSRSVVAMPGLGFRYCEQQGLLGKETAAILEQLSSTIALWTAPETASVSPGQRDQYSLQERFASLLLRLDIEVSETRFRPLEIATMRVAKLYIVGLEHLLTGHSRSGMESILSNIRACLIQASLNYQWCSNLGLFLWIFFSASLLGQGLEFREWLKAECSGIVSRLRFSGTRLEDIMDILGCFLWSSTLLGKRARTLWDEIVDLAP
jgi:hypothetical protein